MALTENDIKRLQELFDDRINKALGDNNKTFKEELAEYLDKRLDQVVTELKTYINEKIAELRNEVMNYIDTFAKEISANRDERVTMAHQIGRNTKRIEKLEDKVLTN